MKNLMIIWTMAAASVSAFAWAGPSSDAFRNIIGDAANIQLDAEALKMDLAAKNLNGGQVRADVATLATHIANLRKDVEAMDANIGSLTDQQKTAWEEAKKRSELLTVYSNLKSMEAESSDLIKNRATLRSYANNIAIHAASLQRYVNRLDH